MGFKLSVDAGILTARHKSKTQNSIISTTRIAIQLLYPNFRPCTIPASTDNLKPMKRINMNAIIKQYVNNRLVNRYCTTVALSSQVL